MDFNKIYKLSEASSSRIPDDAKDMIMRAFMSNSVEVVDTYDDVEDGHKVFVVEAGNSNPTEIGFLRDDLAFLEEKGIGFETDKNDNGFYGKTYVFFMYD